MYVKTNKKRGKDDTNVSLRHWARNQIYENKSETANPVVAESTGLRKCVSVEVKIICSTHKNELFQVKRFGINKTVFDDAWLW